jgi:hypothetical protein
VGEGVGMGMGWLAMLLLGAVFALL